MKTIDLAIESAEVYYKQLKRGESTRYRSWEHCYTAFVKARANDSPDIEYLSLQLAFYLASWGMYRGSSFLLQMDYKIHIPVVEELLKTEYNALLGIDCNDLRKNESQVLLKKLTRFIGNYYDSVRRSIKDPGIKNQISDTLITKVLMGTLGCVPAYDRYFISGIRATSVAGGNFNTRSVLMLADFYENNRSRLEHLRNQMRIGTLSYPQMKVLDMAFWQIGYDIEKRRNG